MNRGDSYQYYLDDQLKSAQFDALNVDTTPSGASNVTTLSYDGNGNRTTESNLATASRSFTANNLNQYTAVSGVASAPVYDTRGNLGDYDGLHLEYDVQSRLTDAVTASDTLYFYYDAFGRQMLRYVNGNWIYSVWDGWNLIEEYTTASTLLHDYLQGVGTDEMVTRWDSGGNRLPRD